jgi:hypothetical protein
VNVIKLIVVLVIVCASGETSAQDIISKDGYNMGPRKYFLEVCAYDENGEVRIEEQFGYSNLDFCNCLAEEMIPLMTKKEINYYFEQNNHTKIFEDKVLSRKAVECMMAAKEKWITPPPQETVVVTSISVRSMIDSIIQLVDYESKFNEILQLRLMELKESSTLDDAQYNSLIESVKFDSINPAVIENAYIDYSNDDIVLIYEYLNNMPKDELSNSDSKYERSMIAYFSKYIELRIQDYLGDSE